MAEILRITEDGETRITEDGENRILEQDGPDSDMIMKVSSNLTGDGALSYPIKKISNGRSNPI